MKKKTVTINIRLAGVVVLSGLFIHGCALFGGKRGETRLVDQPICPALDVNSTRELIDNNFAAKFEQQANDHSAFISVSSNVSNPFDRQNVIALKSARVEFDFEDESVDAGDLGGFWARWKTILIPFDAEIEREFTSQKSDLEKLLHYSKLIERLQNHENKVEAELSGPFLSDTNHCEWGDSDLIPAQTVHYSNRSVYDWDFFPGENRVIGVIYEGDEGVGDDFIAWLDISRDDGEVVVEENGKFRIVLNALGNVPDRVSSLPR
ncbi:MAG: hypothetical protein ACE5HO_14165 [bacterium]